tara:strand:- start:321 stop:698 length:378 start_codon:yes stop_codon:yes gene_type:complete
MILQNYPVRAQISWYFKENKFVSIIIEKKFNKIERIIAKLTKAPKFLTRNLDDMNSRLWILMDGSNNLKEIIEIMDSEFKERIYPTAERVILSIENFLELGLVHLISNSDEVSWTIDPIKHSENN